MSRPTAARQRRNASLLPVTLLLVCVAACGSGSARAPSNDGGDCGCDATGWGGFDTSPGIGPPRLIAPLSSATVTSTRPTLHWSLADGTDGAEIEICRDRTCALPVTSFAADGSSGAPGSAVPAGVLFWRAYGRSHGAVGQEPSPIWQFIAGAASAPTDTSWGTTPDLNGDGRADVIVGASDQVYVYLGQHDGVSAPSAIGNPGMSPAIGTVVASAGDVDGDGYPDVLIGAPDPNGARVHLYRGGENGLAASPALSLAPPPDRLGAGLFGISVASAGDVNGDGYADVLVGDPEIHNGTGQAYLYLGGPNGISGQPDLTVAGPDGANGLFGHSVASAGDVDGDGFADVVVAAVGYANATGRVYVYRGGPTGLTAQPELTLTGPDGPNGHFGRPAVCAGDVNGDGYADLVVSAYGADSSTGRAYLYLGGPTGLAAEPATTLVGPDGTAGYFGYAVVGVGDVDGDGHADVVVGADYVDRSAGRVYLYLGTETGVGSQPAATVIGPDGANGHFGRALGAAGDVDGDGHADVVVGADYVDGMIGRAYLLLGTATGLGSTPDLTLGPPPPGFTLFGVSVATAGPPPRTTRPRRGGRPSI